MYILICAGSVPEGMVCVSVVLFLIKGGVSAFWVGEEWSWRESTEWKEKGVKGVEVWGEGASTAKIPSRWEESRTTGAKRSLYSRDLNQNHRKCSECVKVPALLNQQLLLAGKSPWYFSVVFPQYHTLAGRDNFSVLRQHVISLVCVCVCVCAHAYYI